MNLADILFNAASGGVVGSILHIGTSIFETWRKKKDAEVDVMLMQAKVAAAEKEAAWNAFSKSQENNGSIQIPSNASPIMVNVYLAVDAFKGFTRPGITWALLFVLLYVFSVSPVESQKEMLNQIVFGAFTSLFWWFGSRYQKQ